MSLIQLKMVKDEQGLRSETLWVNPNSVEWVMPHPAYNDRCIAFMWGSGKSFDLMHSCDDVAERLNHGRPKLT